MWSERGGGGLKAVASWDKREQDPPPFQVNFNTMHPDSEKASPAHQAEVTTVVNTFLLNTVSISWTAGLSVSYPVLKTFFCSKCNQTRN